ncbi:DUF4239 domain-containing protein [Streptomyces marincola]|uniref:DUF4239 domain-containing protein n=1 Tax=Streptomyces marincola TaxID=2878388 RepID=A0A1W7CSW0_9ACTN|nr:DUF4239 domain-containing protein [Streptomyces marincola]ARQ67480.1 hypothetical protein CAG99_00260 [Streptomyces marincola]
MSEWLVLAIAVGATCLLVVVAVVLRQRRAGQDDDPSETPDVIEYMTMMIGVVYAIVLGLAIAGVWEARGAADEWVRQEAQALYEVGERAGVFPAEARDRIRADVHAYVAHTVDDEWDYMVEHGELTSQGDELLRQLRGVVLSQDPGTVREAQAYQGMIDQVATADEARVGRGDSAEPTMPPVVWIGLIAGAAVTVGMVFTLQIQRSGRELLLAGMFSALLAFLLFLVWYFDNPFAHGVGNSGEAFRALFPQAVSGG